MGPKSNCTDCEEILNGFDDARGYSVLLGNGILMAKEKLKNEILFGNIYSDLRKELLKTYNLNYCQKEFDCPEKLLNTFRIEVSYKILKKYQEILDLHKKYNTVDFSNATEFLNDFNNIFTINYDSITYKNLINVAQKGSFKDGLFCVDGKFNSVDVSAIRHVIGGSKNGLYFLHGAFHIIHFSPERGDDKGNYDRYFKLTITNKKLLEINNIDLFHSIISNFRVNKENQFSITCVIESRPQNKLAWIQSDPYLSFCLEQLSKQEKVLTLGCSFGNDDHLLEALMLSEALQELKIGVFSKNDVKNVHDALGRIKRLHYIYSIPDKLDIFQNNYEKISFVCTQKLGKILWGQDAPQQCNKLDLTLKNF